MTLFLLFTLASLAHALSPPASLDIYNGKRVLVVGGSGRVGGSCCTQLVKYGSQVTVGGTSSDRFEETRQRWIKLFPELSFDSTKFICLDRENAEIVGKVIEENAFDLVIHTAGPFQGKANTPNGVLEACVTKGIPYVDVCDDYCTARAAKSKYSEIADQTKTPCIVSTGCWPGVSSLMAKQLVTKVLKERPNLEPRDLTVDFSFFTAGSGGAGVTLLVATFLILAEKALTVVDGRRKAVDPMKQYSRVDFGPIIGEKDVAHLNLLETASVSDILGVGSVQSLFGTAPGFWNTLLGAMAQLPDELLANENLMQKLSVFSLPIVRIVDFFAGATNAMRCDVSSKKDPSLKATAIYGHGNLEPCVGECVTAFGAAVLSGLVSPGISFPEEAIREGEDACAVLQMASIGAHTTYATASGIAVDSASVFGQKIENRLAAKV